MKTKKIYFFIVIILTIFCLQAAQASTTEEKLSQVGNIAEDLLSRLHRNTSSYNKETVPVPLTAPATTEEPPPPARKTAQKIEALPSGRTLHPRPHFEKKVAGQMTLATFPGVEAGLVVSRYKYREDVDKNPFMNLKGNKIGAEAAFTHVFSNNWFARAEGRFSYGDVGYSSGSGAGNGIKDYLWDGRALIGKDFIFDRFSLTPYTGYAGRYLYNDLRDVGPGGYRRKSHYEYIPIGIINRFRLNDESRIATTVEYDYFKRGWQDSLLKDWNPALSTLRNKQTKAYINTRGSFLYETENWSMGPWINYWHIDDSRVNCVPGPFCGLEPENKTLEYGLKILCV